MKNTLNITGKIDAVTISVLATFDQVAKSLGVPYLLVGATARDMVLHHGYGIKNERATVDIDMAIQVQDWSMFHAVRSELLLVGYQPGKEKQRLYSPDEMPIDIVPFGGVEDPAMHIAWPPEDDWVMNMMGFTEAHSQAQHVIIQEEPFLSVPIAMPAGIALLKLVAWTDRVVEKRKKDAQDFFYVLSHYESMPEINIRCYSDAEILEQYGGDIELVGAHYLGIDTAAIAKPATHQHIIALLTGKMTKKQLNADRLVHESLSPYTELEFNQRSVMVEAFRNGFCNANTTANP